MERRFDGHTFMVTGAGTGFGAALALRAAQEGAAKLLIHYRSSVDGAERTASRVRAEGAEAALVQGDITSWEDIRRMVRWAFDEQGGIDVLVNNVGDMASGQASWEEVTEEAIDHVLAVDIKGTMLMVHEFGQRMAQRGGGSIVNVGSTVIVRGSPRAPQYAAGKYGLLGITKSYAKALAPTVRVNTFAPGFMETEALLARPEWKAGRRDVVLSGTPTGRIPAPEEMTGAALFLASDDAHHITGSYMIADGGYSMLGA
ncbi:MAG TPA: SDR family oxidoreductase [Solirubrobacteraceae bacterium]|jgi:3-oxoacyl-[acyl-carrier protein] reductase|nr:SDR family oxidoreductase [Solirubrobacteraceae bacterium]